MSVSQSSAATIALDAVSADPLVALVDAQRIAGQHVASGHQLSQRGQFVEAEVHYRKALALAPDHALAHSNLGWTRQMQGDNDGALAGYQQALQIDPHLRIARRNLAMLLVRLGRRDESLHLWHEELLDGPEGLAWMQNLVSTAMQALDLTLAGEYATILAALRRATPWYPQRRDDSMVPLPVQAPDVFLTIPKLRHDIEQFEYLQRQGVLGDEFTAIIEDYQRVIASLEPRGPDARTPLDAEAQRSIGHVYNRIVHIRHTPRVQQVFSDKWDPKAIESQYLDKPLGLVVVDDFLSDEALESLRLFCHESTVWSGNRYGHGRLGAFFHDGFNCPLLLQIAEELRQALPRVIVDRYPLRQLWGFKNGEYLPAGSTTHADFAAVNVNFWITPEEANLDDKSGGLIVYDVDAPLSWDFATYNGRPEVIKAFLQQQNARAITIPYRQNRAIIFNSDLFHASAGLRFRPGYENRRVNITMLYGDRESDVHHRNLAGQDPMGGPDGRPAAWRSAAFSRARTRPGGA
jgi:tetratricopeptide (TPR) repeat protein